MHLINFSSKISSVFVLSFVLFSAPARAQILLEDGAGEAVVQPQAPRTGEGAARQYFTDRNSGGASTDAASDSYGSSGVRYMAIQFGTFMSDTQHRWGVLSREDDVGDLTLGVTYRFGEWVNSMDLMGRIEYQTYDIDTEKPKKLSVLPMISFPDARSGFPLFFGAGAGLGIFFDQAPDESELSVDYQIVGGVRFMNMFPSGGLIVETGLKGHFHLLGSGQFSGTFVSVGGAFTF